MGVVGSEVMAVMGTGCSQVGPHVPYVESYRFWRKWPKKTIRPQFWSVGDYKISTPGLTGVIYWSSAQHGRFPTFLARLLYLREPDIFGVFVTSFYAFLKNCIYLIELGADARCAQSGGIIFPWSIFAQSDHPMPWCRFFNTTPFPNILTHNKTI